MGDEHTHGLSRRRVLRAAGGTAGVAFLGTARAGASEPGQHGEGAGKPPDTGGPSDDEECEYETVHGHGTEKEHGEGEHGDPLQELLCPDHPHATTEPGHTMYHVDAAMGGCPAGTGLSNDCTEAEWPDCTDWPEPTKEIIKRSKAALTAAYSDVGTLVAQGYIPYFDVVLPGATGGVSHWLNPEFIGDDSAAPDPMRPEGIIMDNQWWKPLGPMYIATDEGDLRWADEENEVMAVSDLWGYENACGECYPFHPHDGLPGRFAWWYYRQVHEADYAAGDPEKLTLPCYTAPMMHAWVYPTPDGPHSATSGAPPREYRPGGPPNRPGYPTPAVPGEDELSLDVLPASVREAAMPDRLVRELHVIADLSTETLETTPVAELEELVAARLRGDRTL